MRVRLSFIIGLILFAWAFVYTVLAESEGTLGNIIIDSKKEAMEKAKVKPVVFPHWFHRIRFKCKICHEEIFVMKSGGNDINMGAIIKGEFCGRCHNGYIAFSPAECVRCHSYEPAH